MKQIKLNEKVSIDLDKLIDSRMLIQANSGGGKSWAARRFIEQTFGHKQLIIIDPEGEFGNMRKEFDFVYIAKDGGDAPVEVRSAALLARRLLETKANAIIDIYELGSQRGDFVKAFFDACVNMPKDLWQDCFFLLDEAHKFAPEKGQGESVALQSVIDMASLGRKRGYCLIPLTQRPAKLSKDVVAECNNKLIGRASLDIDRERSAKELGFRSKEDILSLRDLEPGEFYVFGPAISRDVQKTHIGDVKVKPPKRGVTKQSVAAPSATVKKILAKLADLPQAAAEEARTVAELKAALAVAKRELSVKPIEFKVKETFVPDPRAIENAIKVRDIEWKQILQKWKKYAKLMRSRIIELSFGLEEYDGMSDELVATSTKEMPIYRPMSRAEVGSDHAQYKKVTIPVTPPGHVLVEQDNKMGAGERAVLIAIAQQPDGMTREHITVQTGYKRSTRDAYIQRLIQKGYIGFAGVCMITDAGIAALGNDYEPLPTGTFLLMYHLSKLPAGETRILSILSKSDRPLTRDELTDATGFKRSTRDAYIQRLATRKLVVVEGQTIRVSEHLL